MLSKTKDGSLTLYNKSYNELYHSEDGALLEAQSLYMEASGFKSLCQESPSKNTPFIRICDVGLGLAYNALSTLETWTKGSGSFEMEVVSLENDENLFASLRSCQASWQEEWPNHWKSFCEDFKEGSPGVWAKEIEHPSSGKKALWSVYLGDARDSLKNFKERLFPFDFIWQDPFSPKTSPGLWDEAWFKLLTDLSKKDTILMTYSVSGSVRKSLSENGWNWDKIPTTTKKKEWLKSVKS